MRRLGCAAALLASLWLGGCVEMAAAGAVAGAGIAAYSMDAASDDIAEQAVWRAERKALVNDVLNTYRMAAKMFEMAGNLGDAITIYKQMLEFHEEQQPEILLVRLRRHVDKVKNGDVASDEE